MKSIQEQTGQCFRGLFGRTPLNERLEDILKESIELSRFKDMQELKEEAGDVGASLLALCEECGWDFEQLVNHTLLKIQNRARQYQSLGRKTRVALLGGAFDPPTKGHIAVAKFVLDSCNEFDEVWLTPAFKHMHNKRMTKPEIRSQMCKIASEADGRIKVFDYEIRHELGGECYKFLKKLLEDDEYKNEYNFSYIIGTDNANHFDKWVNYKYLEKLVRFVVVARPGEETLFKSRPWYFNPPHIFLQPDGDQIPETASTDIRKEIKTRKSGYGGKILTEQLDPEVYEYIKYQKLYA